MWMTRWSDGKSKDGCGGEGEEVTDGGCWELMIVLMSLESWGLGT